MYQASFVDGQQTLTVILCHPHNVKHPI